MANDGVKIVLFLHHGLGDLLMSLPLLRSLKSANSGDALIFVKSEREAQLLKLAQLGDKFVVKALPRDRVIREALALRRRALNVLLCVHASAGWRMPMLARMIGAEVSVGPESGWAWMGYNTTVPQASGIHKTEYYFGFGMGLNEDVDMVEKDIKIPLPRGIGTEILKGHAFLDDEAPRIVFAPGSGKVESHKRWPAENYVKLGQEIVDWSSKTRLILMGDQDEIGLLQWIAVRINAGEKRCVVVTPGNIGEALALISNCSCMVSNCSGAGHMAAAVDVPVVGIFGPTNPGFTGPYTKKLHAIRLDLPCSPCYREGFIRGCGEPVCMRGISAETVFGAVTAILRGEKYPPVPWVPTKLSGRLKFTNIR